MRGVTGCLLLLGLVSLVPASADLPASWPGVGERLASAVLGPGLAAYVYGPALVRPEEGTTVTVLLTAQASSPLLSGVVQLSCAPETAGLMGVPMPAGAYVGVGEWSADTEDPQAALPPAEIWRPLLPLTPQVDWVLRVPPLVPPDFKGSAGQIVDLLQTWPAQAQPPAARRQDPTDPEAAQAGGTRRQQRAVVFVLGDDLTGALQAAPLPGGKVPTGTGRGAQMIRLTFSLLPRNAPQDLSLWMCVQAPGQSVIHELSIPLRTPGTAPSTSASLLSTPQLLAPAPGTLVSDAVALRGKAYPGTLIVAWIQIPATEQGVAPLPFTPMRQLADMNGAFAFSLPVPPQATPVCELHLRAEAPGYRSPEVVCPLRVAASAQAF